MNYVENILGYNYDSWAPKIKLRGKFLGLKTFKKQVKHLLIFVFKFFLNIVGFNINAGLFVRTNYDSLDPTIKPVKLLGGNESEFIPDDTFCSKPVDLHLEGQYNGCKTGSSEMSQQLIRTLKNIQDKNKF